MSDNNDNGIAGKVAVAAGAAIGSAAIAAAMLWVKRRKDSQAPAQLPPPYPEDAPETD